jgi:hypothetical protein
MSAVLSYFDKWKLDEETEQRRADMNGWLVGIYVQKAINSNFSKHGEYPQSPYYLEKLSKENIAQEDKAMREFIQLDDWRRAFARNFHTNKERS